MLYLLTCSSRWGEQTTPTFSCVQGGAKRRRIIKFWLNHCVNNGLGYRSVSWGGGDAEIPGAVFCWELEN